MDLHTYEILYRIEENHWWHSSRRAIVLDWIRRHYADRRGLYILDAGCGTGLMMKELAVFGDIEGVDISEEALEFCRQRGLHQVRKADVIDLPFPDEIFDVVTALDVVEHLDDDVVALREWYRVLKTGGRVFLFVPAHRWLWSLQDEISHHRRRYTARALAETVSRSGLRVERQSYVNGFLLPVILAGRIWLRVLRRFKHVHTENDLHPSWSNGMLASVFRSEIPLLRRYSLPIGASVLCVAVKDAV